VLPVESVRPCSTACDHPALVAGSTKTDKDAIESRPAKNDDVEDVDELAAAVGKLDVDNEVNKCMICFVP
jgi:hypothetical protein